ncbi:hypothetical protein KQ41_02385 [Lysinibacillus fusiformis]|nr:hypothetical protein KQ41_02385 [Lysinibacillus fusiformis]
MPEEEREVFIDRAQLSIFELHRRCKRGDIILQPSYQRKDVWTRPKKSKLIESILRNIPIPSIYFAETNKGNWEVVDGQQRLTSFFEFLDNKFPLAQLPVLNQFEKKYFKDLESYQRKIEDYQLHIFIIKKESHPDIKFDIFERINEGATQLNAQELRNSIYRGKIIGALENLSKNPNFIRITKGRLQERRLKNEEAMLRFISFYLKTPDKYNGNLNSFLNDTLERNLINDGNLDELKYVIDETMKLIYTVFGEDAFTKPDSKIKKINMSLFDILTYSFANHDSSLIVKNKEKIKEALNNLFINDPEFKRSITSNTLTKKYVNYRFGKWLEILEEILIGDDSK